MKVTIVTLNWNGWPDTIDLLNSLIAVEYEPFSVVVIDNASTDESAEQIEAWMKKNQATYGVLEAPEGAQAGSVGDIAIITGKLESGLNFIRSPVNLGFCRGNNLGLELAFQSGADLAVVLNNDTLVSKGFLTPMVKAVGDNPDVGVVGGVITHCSDPSTIWYAGGRFSRFLTNTRVGNGDPVSSLQGVVEPYETEWISGCMTMIPSWTYEVTKGFSEEYFIWSEEWDHSLRVSQAGFRLMVVPTSRICHKVGKSLGIMKPLNYYYGVRNGLIFQRKFLPPHLWYPYFCYYLLNRFARFLHLVLVGRPDLARAGVAAIRDVIRNKTGIWEAQRRAS